MKYLPEKEDQLSFHWNYIEIMNENRKNVIKSIGIHSLKKVLYIVPTTESPLNTPVIPKVFCPNIFPH